MSSNAKSLIQRHPLQKLPSPSRGFSALVHFVGLLSFAASFKYLVDYPNPINEAYGWHFQYLTIIGLFLATFTFLIGLLADTTLSARLFLLKNALSITSAPLEVLISLLYWGIRSIDANLVTPPFARLSLTADIGFHAIPSLMLLLDLLFLSPPWTITIAPTLAVSGSIAFAYWFWVELCYQRNGWYPYPLFALLNQTQRIALFAGSAAVMTLSTATLKWLYGRVNGYGTGRGPSARPGDVKRA